MTSLLDARRAGSGELPPPSPDSAVGARVFEPPEVDGPAAARHSRSPRDLVLLIARFGLAALAVYGAFQLDGGIFGAIVALFVLTVPFEKLYPRKKGQRIRRPMLGTDLTFALTGPILNVVAIAVVLVIGIFSLFWVPGLLLRPVVAALPGFVVPVAAFVTFDFIAYWAHRWAHEVPALWRFHAVHHSPEHMDWISGVRLHPFDGVLVAPGVFFLLAAGVDGDITGVLAVLQILLGIFFHANVRVRWRWLDRLVCNPEFHHWHHANESDAIGHNYGAALPHWDMAFGTFFMPNRSTDRRPQHYGIDEYIPRSYLGLLTHPFRGGRRHVSLLWHPVRAVRAAARGTRRLLRDVRRSTFRPTHSVRRGSAPGCSSTNASLFDPASAPGVAPSGREVFEL